MDLFLKAVVNTKCILAQAHGWVLFQVVRPVEFALLQQCQLYQQLLKLSQGHPKVGWKVSMVQL